jgi:hypothetical protein
MNKLLNNAFSLIFSAYIVACSLSGIQRQEIERPEISAKITDYYKDGLQSYTRYELGSNGVFTLVINNPKKNPSNNDSLSVIIEPEYLSAIDNWLIANNVSDFQDSYKIDNLKSNIPQRYSTIDSTSGFVGFNYGDRKKSITLEEGFLSAPAELSMVIRELQGLGDYAYHKAHKLK